MRSCFAFRYSSLRNSAPTFLPFSHGSCSVVPISDFTVRILPDESIAAIAERALGTELGVQVHTVALPLATLTQVASVYDAAVEQLLGSVKLSPIVETAKRYIASHFADTDVGLNDVADALNVHPAYLSRLMKQELGMPFAKYLTNIRINKAVQLMRDPEMRIWQVAEMVGYSGGNYFSTAFKKVLGVSPADYRLEDRKL